MNSGKLVTKENVEKNQVKLKDKFKNIKSNYFLEKVFNNLTKKQTLYMLKYNKNLKKRINININDYKDCYELIEIEIKPIYNKYGYFINIKKEEEKYYHIYFDNNIEEIKRNYINKDESIKIINIIIDNHVKSFKDLFLKCINNECIYFKKFYRENINNMSKMFFGSSSLKELNLNNFNTNNVIYMIGMFDGCSNELITKIKTEYKNIKEEAF